MKSEPALPGEPLTLSGDLTIYGVQALKSLLIDALERSPALQLDLSAVQSIDAAGLQVLALLHREAGRAGKALRIAGGSDSVRHFMHVVGMHNFFGDALQNGHDPSGAEAAA